MSGGVRDGRCHLSYLVMEDSDSVLDNPGGSILLSI
jgi:hypothetical protein